MTFSCPATKLTRAVCSARQGSADPLAAASSWASRSASDGSGSNSAAALVGKWLKKVRLETPAAAAMSDYQLAATELALARAKADRGLLDFNAFAAREHALLTLMAAARRAFTSRVPAGSVSPAPWAVSGSAFTVPPGPP